MDILSHTMSGIAVGTVLASYSNKGFKKGFLIVLLCGFAAALPDFDAISLWSGFDSSIGKLFNLNNSGADIYSSKFWYSHHAFLHSSFAAFLFTLLIGLFSYLISTKFRNISITAMLISFKKNSLLLMGFLLSFHIHLLEDMPTPASTWGGVNLLWPSSSYVGGTGDIWWWNNYDIFFIIISVIVINLILLSINKFKKISIKRLCLVVFVLGFTLSCYQVKTRNYDFAYSGNATNYAEMEAVSKELQKDILGDALYKRMEEFDNKLKFYF